MGGLFVTPKLTPILKFNRSLLVEISGRLYLLWHPDLASSHRGRSDHGDETGNHAGVQKGCS